MKVVMVDALVGNEYSLLLCNHLRSLGVKIALIVVRDREVFCPVSFPLWRWAPSKVPGAGRAKKILSYVRYLLRLIRLALRKEADILHFQFLRRERPETILLVLLSRLGVHWVLTAHDLVPHEGSSIDRFLKGLAYRHAELLIVHSRAISQELHRRFSVPYSRICVVPHGDFGVYRPKVRLSSGGARRRLGLSHGEPVVLFFGYIREYKGLDLLMDAFEIAYHRNPSIRLVIAGKCHTKELERHYRLRILALDSAQRIHFRPEFIPWEEVAAYVLSSDLVALPYLRIFHSGVLHLAYSFGRAVLATDVGDFREMIEEDRTGWLVPPRNAEAMASALLEAFSDRKRLKALGLRAERLSKTKYSWTLSAQRTLQAYQDRMGAY